jgi:hypothetical protein
VLVLELELGNHLLCLHVLSLLTPLSHALLVGWSCISPSKLRLVVWMWVCFIVERAYGGLCVSYTYTRLVFVCVVGLPNGKWRLPAGSYCPAGASQPTGCAARVSCPEGSSSGSPYFQGDDNTNLCPIGSEQVLSFSTCYSAAVSLGWQYYDETTSQYLLPIFCLTPLEVGGWGDGGVTGWGLVRENKRDEGGGG